jgi:hypothetical protein
LSFLVAAFGFATSEKSTPPDRIARLYYALLDPEKCAPLFDAEFGNGAWSTY